MIWVRNLFFAAGDGSMFQPVRVTINEYIVSERRAEGGGRIYCF